MYSHDSMSDAMKRIGLTQRVDAYPDRGERRDALDQAWIALLQELGYLPVLLPNLFDDARSYLDTLSVEGVILTGGNDLPEAPGSAADAPERDQFEHSLLDVCAATGRPVLGVCRGLQLAIVHHGGDLVAFEGHVATRHRLLVRPDVHEPLRAREVVNSFHRFGVSSDNLDEQWHVLGTADDGTVEAIRHRDHPLWGIMWHPERDPADAGDRELIHYVFRRK
jgi:putative glutamine amidotransferase